MGCLQSVKKCLDSRNDQLRLVRFLVDQTSSPSSRMVVHDRMLPKNLYQFVWQRISQSLVKWDLKVQGYQPTPLAKNLINIKMLLGPFPNSHDLSQTFSSCRLGFLLPGGTKRPRTQIHWENLVSFTLYMIKVTPGLRDHLSSLVFW